jgi:ATP-dependent Lon protease
LPQDVAITGELSISGKVRPVGGIIEKVYAARQAGMRLVLIPKENEREVERAFGPLAIEPVATIDEALAALGVTRKAKR